MTDEAKMPPAQRRDPPRPRESSRTAILQAAWDLFEERGLGALTVDGIAERAGVGKATIYRWWPHKSAVLLDAMLEQLSAQVPFPDTGSAREDLRVQLTSVAELLTRTTTGDAYLALVADSYGDSLLAENLRDRYIVPRRALATEVLERGVARGELRSDLDFDVTIDAMYGALYYRLLVAHTELDAGYVDQLLDQFYRALT